METLSYYWSYVHRHWCLSLKQEPIMHTFDVLINASLNNLLHKQSRGLWFQTPLCSWDIRVIEAVSFFYHNGSQWEHFNSIFLLPSLNKQLFAWLIVVFVIQLLWWIHCGLVTWYGYINLRQHWLGAWLVAWLATPSHYLNQSWLIIRKVSGIYIRAFSQENFNIFTLNMRFKMTKLLLQPHLPRANVLTRWGQRKLGVFCFRHIQMHFSWPQTMVFLLKFHPICSFGFI